MDSNDDLTIGARIKGWEIFSPDWDYLLQYPALQLGSLCALSVGLHPYFADPSWVFNVAKPHFDGTDSDEFCPLEEAAEGEKRAALLDVFLRRTHIAAANLFPLGALAPAIGDADSVQTLVRVTDFVTWAEDMGWELPPAFPRPLAAPVSIQIAATAGAPESDEATAYHPRIGWQVALYDAWSAMKILHGREPSAAEAIRYLKKNDTSGTILSKGGDNELWWKTNRGKPKEVQFRTVETCISSWRTSGRLPA